MYRYIGKNQAVWFKESFANYGSLLCISETTKSLNKQMSYYLDSTEFSLSKSSFYRNRHYGLFLLPLYIHSKFGGADTIKNILKAYAKTTSAYKAIDNGLRATKSSYSFAVMFAGFKDVNAYTVYYRMPGSSKGLATSGTRKNATRTILTSFDKYDTSVTPAMTLGGSSAAYFEYRAPSSSSGKLTVTVETLSGSTDASYNMVIKGKSITIPARRQTSGLVTFVLTGLGGSVSAAVLTAGNTSMASSDEVSFLATAYFEES
jgi:hypothetical protein